MKRTFLPINKYPFYNDLVDRYMQQSEILNGGSMQIGVHSTIWDKEAILGHIAQIEGDEKGLYLRNGEKHMAYKPFVQMKLDQLESDFEEFKRSRRNQGHEIPEVMTPKMLEQYYTYKARMTVIEEELAELNKRLKSYTSEEQKEDDSMLLKYGLQEVSKCHGLNAEDPSLIDVLKIIDGQKVEMTEDNVLIINDSRSPYSGMLVSDYRKLCKQWKNEVKQIQLDEFVKIQDRCRAEGLPIPKIPIRALRKVSKGSLPKWPEWAVNHLKNESVTK